VLGQIITINLISIHKKWEKWILCWILHFPQLFGYKVVPVLMALQLHVTWRIIKGTGQANYMKNYFNFKITQF